VKLLRYSVSFAVIAAGLVGLASSCSSSSTGFGGAITTDAGLIIEPDGAMFVSTDGGLVQVVINDAGMLMVAPGSDASLPPGFEGGSFPPPGSDATTIPGSDATTIPGSDAETTVDGACPGTTPPPACTPTSTGGIPLSSSYLAASAVPGLGLSVGGYAYFYDDSMTAGGTSTACIEQTQVCTKGTTNVADTLGAHYGAGIGFNLNQAQATGCTSTPIQPFTVPTSVGISYSLSNLPAGGARIIIGNMVTTNGVTTGTDYCAPVAAVSGTIPWAKFNSACWDDSGTFLAAPPVGPIHINIGLPSGPTAETFDFCVDSIGFATTLSDAGGGGTVTSCGGSACCSPSSGPSSSTGTNGLTCYTFNPGQPGGGTPGDKTYCGYQGAETAYTGGLSGACASGTLAYTDTVPNVGPPSDYFAAFPGPGGAFGNGTLCGLCVDVTYAGTTLMATVVDECPSASNNLCGVGSGHLDLSAALARDLGFGVKGVEGDPTTGVSWKAVACPISSDIIEVFNGSANQVYLQNLVWPVASVSLGGTAVTQSNGIWMFNGATAGKITLTDTYGHTVSGTLQGINGSSLGVQFPATCN
jgi:hypothetical protein